MQWLEWTFFFLKRLQNIDVAEHCTPPRYCIIIAIHTLFITAGHIIIINNTIYPIYNNFIIQPPVFTATPGVVPDMESSGPIEFFRLFFDEEVLELLHSETTRYTNQYLEREEEHMAHTHRRGHMSGGGHHSP